MQHLETDAFTFVPEEKQEMDLAATHKALYVNEAVEVEYFKETKSKSLTAKEVKANEKFRAQFRVLIKQIVEWGRENLGKKEEDEKSAEPKAQEAQPAAAVNQVQPAALNQAPARNLEIKGIAPNQPAERKDAKERENKARDGREVKDLAIEKRLAGMLQFPDRMFDEAFAGNQTALFFTDLKRNLEIIWYLLALSKMDLAKKKNLFEDLRQIIGVQTCGPGVGERVKDLVFTYNNTTIVSIYYLLAKLRRELIKLFAAAHCHKKKVPEGNSSHAFDAFAYHARDNKLAPLGITAESKDQFLELGQVTKEDLPPFLVYFAQEYNLDFILEKILEYFSEKLKDKIKDFSTTGLIPVTDPDKPEEDQDGLKEVALILKAMQLDISMDIFDHVEIEPTADAKLEPQLNAKAKHKNYVRFNPDKFKVRLIESFTPDFAVEREFNDFLVDLRPYHSSEEKEIKETLELTVPAPIKPRKEGKKLAKTFFSLFDKHRFIEELKDLLEKHHLPRDSFNHIFVVNQDRTKVIFHRQQFVNLLLQQAKLNRKALFRQSAMTQWKNAEDMSLLHLAAQRGEIETVNLLLQQQNIDVDALDKHGNTAMYHAVANGHLAVVIALKNAKSNLSKKLFSDGTHYLHVAAKFGRTEVMRFLLTENPGCVDVEDEMGQTPLILAVRYGHKAAAEFLLKNKANPNATSETGMTPLFSLQSSPDRKLSKQENEARLVDMASLLLEYKADITYVNPTTQSHIFFVAVAARSLALLKLFFEKIPQLLKEINADKNNVLHRATHMDADEEVLEFLLAQGFAIDQPDRLGLSILQLSVEFCRVNLVKFFLRKGADVNFANKIRETAAHMAIRNYQDTASSNNSADLKKSIEVLFDILGNDKVKLDVRNIVDETPLQRKPGGLALLILAIRHKRKDVVTNLLNAKLNGTPQIDINQPDDNGLTPLHHAMISDDNELINLLLQFRANPLARDKNGDTPLHYAAARGLTNIITQFCKPGECKSLDCRNEKGETPLHLALSSGRLEVATQLINAGVNLKCVTHNRVSYLHLAAGRGFSDLFPQLLKAIPVDSIDKEYVATPLMMAAAYGHHAAVVELLKARANPNLKDKLGRTPFLLAAHSSPRNGPDARKVLETLIKFKQIDPAQTDLEGNNIYHQVVNFGMPEILLYLKNLLEKNLRQKLANQKNKHGQAPIHIAAMQEDGDYFNFLINHAGKIDFNLQNADGDTALHIGIRLLNYAVVIQLGAENAHANIPNNLGKTAAHLAFESGDVNIIFWLLTTSNVKLDVRDKAGNLPTLPQGFDLQTLLFEALQQNQLDAANKLLDYKTILNLPAEALLCDLIKSQNEKMAIALIQTRRVNLNFQDQNKKTPLQLAIETRQLAVVVMLLSGRDYRANPNIAAENPLLQVALEKNHVGIVCELMLRGATLPPEHKLTQSSEINHLELMKTAAHRLDQMTDVTEKLVCIDDFLTAEKRIQGCLSKQPASPANFGENNAIDEFRERITRMRTEITTQIYSSSANRAHARTHGDACPCRLV